MSLPPLVEPLDALSSREHLRTARHQRLAGLGSEGQRRIAAASVGVIGAGGLGAPVVLALAAAGIGRIVVFDDDDIELSNLQRQVIHRLQDVGRPKTDSVVRVASDLSETEVRVVGTRLTLDNAAELISGVDLVLDGTDSFESREVIAGACERLAIPLVWGSVQEFAGLVTVFWSAPPEGADAVRLHDLYPPGSEAPACSAVGVFGPMCLQAGSMMAAEALKLITGIGRPLLGRIAMIDVLAGTVREVPLRAARTTAPASPPASPAAPQTIPAVDDPADGTVVIDVREADEVATGMLPGARHLPLASLLGDVDTVAAELAGSEVVVVCQVGMRARRAAQALRGAGVDAVVLRGGMDGYNSRRQPA
ncbi:molybdopterin/thiamine biosynthesis adenylyltransferase/rhodanese-related sulfurtransferase [Microbacterium sp. W4I4]|uniref:ThiF family adenylyltransferase n=1 Tax=Microbacterium sp. W4I4 TaxID=3042295 RepID=UPI002783D7BE|nr:ThiF family adenylyltransferase [Microbacterium sp. W4I4]MDQ0615655.1 molybdopterin/thiamine biosynthesis adenylyltransferase/rhodanese-related sulfurtransferase [Microbacterium sp. W4I4]